jgi:peptidoglycan hydrolase-like protein with peptidoglycan-binding domain
MKKIAVALLATTMLASPAAFAASSNDQQKPQGQQTQQNMNKDQNQQSSQNQPQSNQQSAQNKQNQPQSNQQSAQNKQNQPQGNQQSAMNNQPIDTQSLSRGEIKQVQQALDKDGFKAGRADGRWGRETENAVKQFQESKQLQATGQLDRQTVADLGLDANKFSQSQNR